MGGGGSKQSVSVSDSFGIANTVITNTIQNCLTDSSANNTLNINGSGNKVMDVGQHTTVTLSTNCPETAQLTNTSNTAIENAISQSLSTQQQDLTGFLDSSNEQASTAVSTNISNILSSSTINNCLTQTYGNNGININGNGNELIDIVQTSSLNSMMSCSTNTAETASELSTATNTINQTGMYSSQGMLQEIAQLIEALFSSIVAVGVILFIFIVIAIILWKIHKSHTSSYSVQDLQKQIDSKKKEKAQQDLIQKEQAELAALSAK